MPANVLKWIAGALILHDAIIAPAVLVAGFAARAPAAGRDPRRACRRRSPSARVVVVMSVPVLKAVGRRPDNPSLLPHDYGQNLAIVIAVILAGGTLLTLARARHARRSVAP